MVAERFDSAPKHLYCKALRPMITQPNTVQLAERIQQVFPSMEWRRALAIARYYHNPDRPIKQVAHVHSGTEFVVCLVAAHVRHTETDYESRYPVGYHAPELRQSARAAVQPVVSEIINKWRVSK